MDKSYIHRHSLQLNVCMTYTSACAETQSTRTISTNTQTPFATPTSVRRHQAHMICMYAFPLPLPLPLLMLLLVPDVPPNMKRSRQKED